MPTKRKRLAAAVLNFKAVTDGKLENRPARVRLLRDEVARANSDLAHCALTLAARQACPS